MKLSFLFWLGLLLGAWWPGPAGAQSRRLQRLRAQVARHPTPGLARERALWALAWDNELPAPTQDSLAALGGALAQRLPDPAGQLTARVFALHRLALAGRYQPAQAGLTAALPEARRLGDQRLEIQILFDLGRNQWGTSTHPQALGYWQRAWALAQRQPDVVLRSRSARLLGSFYNDYAQALEWLFRSLKLAEQADYEAGQAEALSNIAYNYAELNDLARSQAYYQRALRLNQQIRSQPGLRRVLISLGYQRFLQGQYAAAIADFQQAARYAPPPTDQMNIAACLADAYERQGNFPQATAHAYRALALARQLANAGAITTVYATLAQTFLHAGQLDSALHYGHRAYARRPAKSMQPLARDVCRVLAQAYARRGDFARAYQFQGRYLAYNDTLTNERIRNGANQAQFTYQLEKKQARIALLERDRELARLRRQRELALGILAGLLLLGTAGAGVAAYRRRQSRRVAALREQIAADLHDEVGGLLTQISLEGAILRDSHPVSAAQVRHLDRVADVSQQAARQLRDVVWSIDTRHDSFAALLDHLRDYLHGLLGTADLEADFVADPGLAALPLPLAVRDALYFVYKEALHNIVKHAQARRVCVALHHQGRSWLALTVDDDGLGLPAALTAAVAPGTRGLTNMRRRAGAAGGQLAYQPSPLGGLRVYLRLPLK